MNTVRKKPLWFRILRALAVVIILLVASALFALWYTGAWNVFFPSSDHDKVPPQIVGEIPRPAILLFTKTNSFRHIDGIAGGNAFFTAVAKKNRWGIYHTENGAVFNPDDLARFDAVVFNNASGDMLNEAQEQAFIEWMEAGGGWIGIHAAGDASHLGWQWYRDNLIGADFTAHIMGPQFQAANVETEQPDHPVMRGVSPQWSHEEEWYSWASSPREEGFFILATVDEDSYSPEQRMFGSNRDLRMGDHPVVWSNCVGSGRSLYSTMGHRGMAFDVPEIKRILENGLKWVMGLTGEACP